MIFEEHHFEYGDFISREYGLIFAHADTSSFLSIAGDVASTYVFNKKNNTRYIIGNDYTESPLSFEIDIVTDDGMALTKENRRAVEKILFDKPYFQRLYVDLADDCMGETYEFVNGEMKRFYLNCRMMNPVKIEDGGGRVVGYKCTVECDCGYLLQDEINMEYVLDPDVGNAAVDVEVRTDTNGYVYPLVRVECGELEGGTDAEPKLSFEIINRLDDPERTTVFYNLGSRAVVLMNSDTNYINGDYYEHFGGRRQFPRLLDGVNRIVVNGSVSKLQLIWTNRRFL